VCDPDGVQGLITRKDLGSVTVEALLKDETKKVISRFSSYSQLKLLTRRSRATRAIEKSARHSGLLGKC
jgi:hypothetical protein